MIHVLCAGRDPFLLATRKMLLEKAGYRVHVALGIDAAMSAHLLYSFEIVVLCQTFSEREQLELAHKLREQRPWVRVVNMDSAQGGANYELPRFLAAIRAAVKTSGSNQSWKNGTA